jgi:phage shock protein A
MFFSTDKFRRNVFLTKITAVKNIFPNHKISVFCSKTKNFVRATFVANFATDVAKFKTSVAKFKTSVAKFETSVAKFKTSVAKFKTNVAKFKTSVAKFKTNVAKFATSVAKFKTNVARTATIVDNPLKMIALMETRVFAFPQAVGVAVTKIKSFGPAVEAA